MNLLFMPFSFILCSNICLIGGGDYFVFLLTGKIFFLWFSKAITTASTSIAGNKGLISQRNLPKVIFPMTSILEISYKQILALAVLLLVLLCKGYTDIFNWWQLFPLLFIQLFLISGISFIFVLSSTYFPDFKLLIPVFMMGMMFCSGVFWDLTNIANEQARQMMLLFNPLLTIIDGYRQILMYGNSLKIGATLIALIQSLFLFVAGGWVLYLLGPKLTRRLFQ